jgi:hypothetical protein
VRDLESKADSSGTHRLGMTNRPHAAVTALAFKWFGFGCGPPVAPPSGDTSKFKLTRTLTTLPMMLTSL